MHSLSFFSFKDKLIDSFYQTKIDLFVKMKMYVRIFTKQKLCPELVDNSFVLML